MTGLSERTQQEYEEAEYVIRQHWPEACAVSRHGYEGTNNPQEAVVEALKPFLARICAKYPVADRDDILGECNHQIALLMYKNARKDNILGFILTSCNGVAFNYISRKKDFFSKKAGIKVYIDADSSEDETWSTISDSRGSEDVYENLFGSGFMADFALAFDRLNSREQKFFLEWQWNIDAKERSKIAENYNYSEGQAYRYWNTIIGKLRTMLAEHAPAKAT
jgi:hypothetical protein